MSRVTRARILRGAGAEGARPLRPALEVPLGSRVSAAEAAATERARQILEAASRQAERLLAEARREADEVRLDAEEAARAEALAHVAVTLARLVERERAADVATLERTVALATLIAERLLGEALGLEPSRVATLARTALEDATGARAVGLAAHPDDAHLLRDHLADVTGRALVIKDDSALARGDLRLETDIGVLEARLGARVARLAERLRESLAP
jgi:flagellar biosynthesis/type III secretory pathway protein FliH